MRNSPLMNILVFCHGNICRSPAAEGILKKHFPEFQIDSAGVSGIHAGEAPDHRSILVCAKNDIDISDFRARAMTAEDGEKFDVLLGMDEDNIFRARRIIPEIFHSKIHLFAEPKEIADPYYSDISAFETMFEEIMAATIQWEKRFK